MAKTSDGKEKAKHHFVQRAHLKNFADNGQIDVIDRATGKVRSRQGIESVAAVRGFYNFQDADGETNGGLENAFADEVEAPAMRIITKLCSIFPYVPHTEEKSRLAYYIALQYLRTPERRRAFELHANFFAEIQAFNLSNDREKIREGLKHQGKDHSDEAVTRIQEALQDDSRELEAIPPPNMWLQHLIDGMNRVAPLLAEQYNWHLITFAEPSLITGDHPVILRDLSPTFHGVGFADADEIVFSLSTKVALMLARDRSLPESIMRNASALAADIINDAVMHWSYLEFYTHPAITSRYSDRPLGKRALFSIENAPPEVKFFEKYNRPPERVRPRR